MQTEYKILFAILEQIDWRLDASENAITLNNRQLAPKLGWNSAEWKDNGKRFAYYLRNELMEMIKKTIITIESLNEKGLYIIEPLIHRVRGDNFYTEITINPAMMPYLCGFVNGYIGGRYVTYWLEDIYSVDSKHAQRLYFALKFNQFKHYKENVLTINFTEAQLKDEVFGLEKDKYTVVVNGTRCFKRGNFQKFVIDKAISDINTKSKLIRILPMLDEKGNEILDKDGNPVYYKLVKKRYYFRYAVNTALIDKFKYETHFAKGAEVDIRSRDYYSFDSPKILLEFLMLFQMRKTNWILNKGEKFA